MAKELLIETLKALAFAAMLGVILVGVALLAGCVEGDGFSNRGRPSRPACVKKDSRGNERWFDC